MLRAPLPGRRQASRSMHRRCHRIKDNPLGVADAAKAGHAYLRGHIAYTASSRPPRQAASEHDRHGQDQSVARLPSGHAVRKSDQAPVAIAKPIKTGNAQRMSRRVLISAERKPRRYATTPSHTAEMCAGFVHVQGSSDRGERARWGQCGRSQTLQPIPMGVATAGSMFKP